MADITPAMARMARAALAVDRRTAAEMVGVSFPTLSRVEQGVQGVRRDTIELIRAGYEKLGVQFLWAGGRVAVTVLENAK